MVQRRFTRIQFTTKVFIKSKNRSFQAASKNISVKGLLVRSHENLGVGEPVEIDIVLPSASRGSLVKIFGVVARVEKEELAFEFGKLDPDTFIHLKDILLRKTSHRLKPYMG